MKLSPINISWHTFELLLAWCWLLARKGCTALRLGRLLHRPTELARGSKHHISLDVYRMKVGGLLRRSCFVFCFLRYCSWFLLCASRFLLSALSFLFLASGSLPSAFVFCWLSACCFLFHAFCCLHSLSCFLLFAVSFWFPVSCCLRAPERSLFLIIVSRFSLTALSFPMAAICDCCCFASCFFLSALYLPFSIMCHNLSSFSTCSSCFPSSSSSCR